MDSVCHCDEVQNLNVGLSVRHSLIMSHMMSARVSWSHRARQHQMSPVSITQNIRRPEEWTCVCVRLGICVPVYEFFCFSKILFYTICNGWGLEWDLVSLLLLHLSLGECAGFRGVFLPGILMWRRVDELFPVRCCFWLFWKKLFSPEFAMRSSENCTWYVYDFVCFLPLSVRQVESTFWHEFCKHFDFGHLTPIQVPRHAVYAMSGEKHFIALDWMGPIIVIIIIVITRVIKFKLTVRCVSSPFCVLF